MHIVKDNLFPVPPLFELIQKESGTEWQEMYKVFNMGHRMEFYTDEDTAKEILEIAAGYNIEGRIVGRCYEGNGSNKLEIITEKGKFVY
jgi:phosphoribosylformylglycinamidine cyclo-ligase